MIKTMQQTGYTFLIDFFIMPLHVQGQSPVFIEGIMANRGIDIEAGRYFPACLEHLTKPIYVKDNAIGLLITGVDTIIRFPFILLTHVSCSIFLATKFIFSFIAFSLFCASTNQEERNKVAANAVESDDIVIETEIKKVLACFCREYFFKTVLLLISPFLYFGTQMWLFIAMVSDMREARRCSQEL